MALSSLHSLLRRGAARLALWALLASWVGLAGASTVTLSNLSALWFDATPAANASYFNNPSATPGVRWGAGASLASGLDFALSAPPVSFSLGASPSANQVLGTLTHLNYPINAGTELSQVSLELSAEVWVDGISQGPRSFDFALAILETVNTLDPCPDGGANYTGVNVNGCADRISLAGWLPTSGSFLVGSELYSLNLGGLSYDASGLPLLSSIWTAESGSNSAYLTAYVARQADLVPEPGSAALAGLGLLGLWLVQRRAHPRA